jgi:outer membrane lipoprotein-sorting protein
MKNARYLSVLAAAFVLAALASTAFAAPPGDDSAPSVDEIVQKTNQASYYMGKDGRAQVSMTIVDGQGRERAREFTILRRDNDAPDSFTGAPDTFTGGQKFYVYFHRPADVNKMAFLVWKHLDRDDDRWLYLPALDLVKRIAAGDKRTSFVGSTFFYEDVSGRNIDDDTHELVETTDNYYVLKNVPKDPGAVEFADYTMWIHKASFIPVKIEYHDKQGKAYRVYEAKGVETIQGYPTVTKSRMTDLRTGGYTDLSYSDVQYDVGTPDDVFTDRYLRRAPRSYLK